jgi:hypothetical protein
MIDENENLSLIKLVSGEEIISMVSSIEDNDLKLLLLNHPCKVTTIRNSSNGKDQGIKFDHWMKFSDEYVFTINFTKVITMTLVKNPQLKFLYKKFIDKYGDQEISHNDNYYEIKPNKELGLLGKVDDIRDKLESLFNSKSISSI